MKLDYQILLKSPPNLTGWIRPWCTVPSIGSAPGVQCRLLDPPLVYSAVYWQFQPWSQDRQNILMTYAFFKRFKIALSVRNILRRDS